MAIVLWARLLVEYHEDRHRAAKSIQGGWRAHIARGILYHARRHTAALNVKRWWRGAYVRKFVAPHRRQIRRSEDLRRRVYARMSMAGCLFCFQTWHANMVSIKLERQHFHLARQIADQKWVRHCVLRIQTAWRHFFYTYVDVTNSGNNGTTSWLHLSSIEFGRATLRVRALRSRLHPRLTTLVQQLEGVAAAVRVGRVQRAAATGATGGATATGGLVRGDTASSMMAAA